MPRQLLSKTIPVFLRFQQKYKYKTGPEIRLKKSDFSIEIDLAPILKRQSAPENGWMDAAQQVATHPHCPLNTESFSESNALICAV
jgi:hypothetical protein